MATSQGLSVTSSVGHPLCPYGIAQCRVSVMSTCGLFKKCRVVCCVVWLPVVLGRFPG